MIEKTKGKDVDFLYFAYGSNLDETQMKFRCPGSVLLHTGHLKGYHLAFGNHSSYRAGGVATILPCLEENFKTVGFNEENCGVDGSLYLLKKEDMANLDHWEAYPHKYDRKEVPVQDKEGQIHQAQTYILKKYFPNPPSPEYHGIIQTAYHTFGFDLGRLKLAMDASASSSDV